MEKIVMQALLYDFYGELLNRHQKSIYEDYVYNNIGISEIAEERGISRQSVHDLIKRCSKALEEYEEKLHLVEKFNETKKLAGRIRSLTDEFGKGYDEKVIKDIKDISARLTEL
ncbi:MAG: YlxM family DNA-binding protein [Lachnospiraceae bacterium]